MTEKQIILSPISFDDLKTEIREIIKEEVGNNLTTSTELPKATRYCSRKDLKRELGLSDPTIIKYEKAGILNKLVIGTRVRYRRDEVDAALRKSK